MTGDALCPDGSKTMKDFRAVPVASVTYSGSGSLVSVRAMLAFYRWKFCGSCNLA
jgi:hypothetical protein